MNAHNPNAAAYHQKIEGLEAEVARLRDFISACPLLHKDSRHRIGVRFSSEDDPLGRDGAQFQKDGIAWVAQAEEEALKL